MHKKYAEKMYTQKIHAQKIKSQGLIYNIVAASNINKKKAFFTKKRAFKISTPPIQTSLYSFYIKMNFS